MSLLSSPLGLLVSAVTDRTAGRSTGLRASLSYLGQLGRFAALARQRSELRELTDEQLTDLGLSDEARRLEAGRPFWDAPDHWYR